MSHAVSAMGTVDPERVERRVRLLSEPSVRDQINRIMAAAYHCLKTTHDIDFARLERLLNREGVRGLWDEASSRVSSVWLAVEALSSTLEPLERQHEASRESSDDELDFEADFSEQSRSASERSVNKRALTPLERIAETAWATGFVLNGEISQFRGRLDGLLDSDDPWNLLSALQDHVGHIRAAVNAIITGVFASLPAALDEKEENEQDLELMASRELRILVFDLRDKIVRIESRINSLPPKDWEKFLRLALQMIEGFMFGPGFGWMRASDKRTFILQHRALFEILQMWNPLRAAPGKHLVSNMARYLEALEVINQREHLQTHDKKHLEILVQQLIRSRDATDEVVKRHAVAAGLAALAELQGADSGLDQLLQRTLEPGSPVPEREILHVASELLKRRPD